MNTTETVPNHLINEKSPYLLQHAQNPVDWYPWSGQAFQKAADEDKPVFLSIGYSTCHWCHVMAHESFEDEQIARLLNTYFVPVKVDREERPEIDTVYMSVCQAMTGQGGWPLTIIMTPDKKPFFAGTYLPRRSRYNMTGLTELLTGITEIWNSDRKRLLNISEEILSVLKRREHGDSRGDSHRKNLTESPGNSLAGSPGDSLAGRHEELSWALARQGFLELKAAFDRDYGGFGRAPKFPCPHNLLFLMIYYLQTGEAQAMAMAKQTLDSMARGGIHDQIGGGFSRYSTDTMWLVPHFEKMLYDNALLALAYLEGYRMTGSSYYRKITAGILDYVKRELTGNEGGFYCGQDADSQGVEGKYYVFTKEEIGLALGNKADQEAFCQWFGITKKGNFEGQNIPNLINNPDYTAIDSHMETLCKKMYKYRLNRVPLHRDDKILTSWNSMMIMAYAKAGFLLDHPVFTETAKLAQAFLEQNLADKSGRLLVRYRDGESAFPGNLDDYAYYCLALLSLYETTLDVTYLELAVCRARQMTELFWDRENGGYYFYGNDVPELIHRPKETYDGAIPSGNSAAAHVLLSLAALTADLSWQELADRQMDFLAADSRGALSAHSFFLMVLIRALGEEKQLVCVSALNKVPNELVQYRRKTDSQMLSVLFKCPDNAERLSRLAPFTADYPIPEQGVCYYLCEHHACGLPFTSLEQMEKEPAGKGRP